jgi:phage terminase small subunit
MAGRKPKPTRLKLIEGVSSKSRLNQAEPKPSGVASRPRWLCKDAEKIWDDHAPELARLGLLTSIDGVMFGAWAELAAEFACDPKLMSASRIAQMRALASSFGLEPSARARLGGSGDGTTEKDPAEAFFA